MKKTINQLKKLYRLDRKEKLKTQKKKRNLEKKIRNLTETNKIKLEEFQSDNTFISQNFSDKIKAKINKLDWMYCCVHFPNGIDVIKRFKIVRKNVVEIGEQLYMFSQKAIRYINGKPIVYFYYSNPFCKIIKVTDEKTSIDGSSFTQVQQSKFVEDVVRGAKEKPSSAIVVLIIGFAIIGLLTLAILIINITIMNGLK